ncbi:Holliday junction ATP-dependent DNA helicase RuvA [Insulibacter thermoxylanivorax]|uniref:Holliday junction branch migration complex subunit RuvA n=1 Tax=Insulibacter thermoxylanivorax TaxID=2749268 RepID=A0A916VGU2_9BACL|nr:Holliday junction branch migration protein RuvA [Insulibacter thermoxylanivorax]GFR38886.1 Holliday junction ATP-dependent DNA helicase RuvA [Insulibacter thermoxylanivorax]
MIDYVRGTIAYIESDYAVVDVNGIGYQVYVSNPYALLNQDSDVVLYTHQHVREDAILLYGFPTREEQRLFRKLLEVSGIGPKVALGILAGGRPEALVVAIQREDIAYLTRLPGVGKKTAQRMILDLKDKLDSFSDVIVKEELPAVPATDTASPWQEAKEALLALGYREAEADRAWQMIQGKVSDEDTVETLMKKALQVLFTAK